MNQRYVCPAEYITKTKANTNPNPLVLLLGLGLGLELVFWLVLGFVLVMYSAGQNIDGTYFGLGRFYPPMTDVFKLSIDFHPPHQNRW